MLQDGYTNIPEGKIAAIVTFLEMSEQPDWIDTADTRGLQFVEQLNIDLAWYRDYFRRIGENWLWVSRLMMSDDDLRQTLDDPDKKIFAVQLDGKNIGVCELQDKPGNAVEIAFFGLMGEYTGAGFGRAMMAQALRRSWGKSPTKVNLQTCTLDHPTAIRFYQKCGFVPVTQLIQLLDDPRLTGLIDEKLAPHIPLIKHRR